MTIYERALELGHNRPRPQLGARAAYFKRAIRDRLIEHKQYQLMSRARIEWHGVELGRPDWRDCSHSLAFTITSLRGHLRLHAMLNAYWEPLRFELPPPADGGSAWLRWIDTSLTSPDDILPWEKAPVIAEGHYLVQPRSLAFLVASTTTRAVTAPLRRAEEVFRVRHGAPARSRRLHERVNTPLPQRAADAARNPKTIHSNDGDH